MKYDVDEFEILPEEKSKPPGKRLTIFKCTFCDVSLSEEELSAIRYAKAPCMHYQCSVEAYYEKKNKQ